jgi:hypothetical protein
MLAIAIFSYSPHCFSVEILAFKSMISGVEKND